MNNIISTTEIGVARGGDTGTNQHPSTRDLQWMKLIFEKTNCYPPSANPCNATVN